MMPISPRLSGCPEFPDWCWVDDPQSSASPPASDPIVIPGSGHRPRHADRAPRSRQDEAARLIEGARALAAEIGWQPAPGGTTGALQLCDRSGRLHAVFKPLLAQTDGGRTAQVPVLREALASHAADEIRRQTGLDLGVPLAVPAILQDRPGVLIQGLEGNCLDFERWYADLIAGRIDESGYRREQQRAELQLRRVPLAQRQQAMLAKLALGDLDIKWGNVIVGHGPERHCHPIDFGLAFPSEDDMRKALRDRAIPDTLAFGAGGKWDDDGDRPLDQGLAHGFARINAAALETRLRIASRALGVLTRDWASYLPAGTSVSPPDDVSIARAVASLRLVQRLLRDGGLLSMRELGARYAQALHEPAAALSGSPRRPAIAAENRIEALRAARAEDARILKGWEALTTLDHRRWIAARDGLLLPDDVEQWPQAHRSRWLAGHIAQVVKAHSEDGITRLDPALAVPPEDPDRSERIGLLSGALAKAVQPSRGFGPFRRSSDPVMKDLLERALSLDRIDDVKQAQEAGLALLADASRFRTHLEAALSELDERDIKPLDVARQRLRALEVVATHARAYCRREIPTHTDRPGAGS